MDLYVAPEIAAERLLSRAPLRGAVEEWWGERYGSLPPVPRDVPNLAVLSRSLATARYEDVLFRLLARRHGLEPSWLSVKAQAMCCTSPGLASYVSGTMCVGVSRRGHAIFRRHEWLAPRCAPKPKAVGLPKCDSPVHANHGEPLCSIIAPDGRSLPAIHDCHRRAVFPRVGAGRVFDMSLWYEKAGLGRAGDYYAPLLAIFVAHGVLFEDFHHGESGSRLAEFTRRVVEPAFAEIEGVFGVSPLITRLPWWRELAFYPGPQAGPHETHGVIPREYF